MDLKIVGQTLPDAMQEGSACLFGLLSSEIGPDLAFEIAFEPWIRAVMQARFQHLPPDQGLLDGLPKQ